MEHRKDFIEGSIASRVLDDKRSTKAWLKFSGEDGNATNNTSTNTKNLADKPNKPKNYGPVHEGEPDSNISDGEESDACPYVQFDYKTWPLKDMLGDGEDFEYAPCRINAFYLEVKASEMTGIGGSVAKWDEEEVVVARMKSPGIESRDFADLLSLPKVSSRFGQEQNTLGNVGVSFLSLAIRSEIEADPAQKRDARQKRPFSSGHREGGPGTQSHGVPRP